MQGVVPLTHRHVPHAAFEKTAAGDGFDAIESWLPGGRVDSFEWTWRWFTNGIEPPPGKAGSSVADDTFTLRRPQGSRSRFGAAVSLEQPLPGLDGSGRVCLVVQGTQVESGDGRARAGDERQGVRGVRLRVQAPVPRWAPMRGCAIRCAWSARDRPRKSPSCASAFPSSGRRLPIRWYLHLGDRWDDEAAGELQSGLERCRREGAGLVVLVLFEDGALGRRAAELAPLLQGLRDRLPAPLLVNEDVRGGWRNALAIPVRDGQPVWRLVDPDGHVRWSHEGRVEGALLASMLDERLVSSVPAGFGRISPTLDVGNHVPIQLVTPQCPPVPLARAGTAGSTLVFVHKDDGARLARLAPAHQDSERIEDVPYVAVVVEGANREEVEALRKQWNIHVPVFPDQSGQLTRRAGVRVLAVDAEHRQSGPGHGL